ncbi:hypothetical protein C7974DRAFT_446795, partial [Boeremia exigua]|uniref:uncharacterized protein n=1 Tax=Boeremia exigua TaxID=749465 RepID=UPI001E8E0EB6
IRPTILLFFDFISTHQNTTLPSNNVRRPRFNSTHLSMSTPMPQMEAGEETNRRPSTQDPPADAAKVAICTFAEFKSLASTHWDVNDAKFKDLERPLEHFYNAVTDALQISCLRKAHSAIMHAYLALPNSVVYLAIEKPVPCKSCALKWSGKDMEAFAAQLLASDGARAELERRLQAQQRLAASLAAENRTLLKEGEVQQKEAELQQKTFDEQQRRLEGSFSQKVEQRVEKRVKEEQSAMAERLAAAEIKAHKLDAATTRLHELETKISEAAHEKAAWTATRSMLETDIKALQHNNTALQQGYDQLRTQQQAAELTALELLQHLASLATARGPAPLPPPATPPCPPPAPQPVLPNTTEPERLHRLQSALEREHAREQAEQHSLAAETAAVDAEIALRHVESGRLADAAKQKLEAHLRNTAAGGPGHGNGQRDGGGRRRGLAVGCEDGEDGEDFPALPATGGARGGSLASVRVSAAEKGGKGGAGKKLKGTGEPET